MHVDINSCFATVEQQANPGLRGKPVAVAAYVKEYGCILAASKEAKKLGVKTGMRVCDGRALAPDLVVLAPDPPKYRIVNRQLLSILQSYTAYVSVESIDEMVMNFYSSPILYTFLKKHAACHPSHADPLNRESRIMSHECAIHDSVFTIHEVINVMQAIAQEIKRRIRNEIGEWITVSCGIAPNRYLAKVASGLKKPDGLVAITRENIRETFSRMQLEDLCGIKKGNGSRLRAAGICSPLAFFQASAVDLKRAFHSITGYQWWFRLHGYDPSANSGQGTVSSFEVPSQDQKSFGQSYVLGSPRLPNDPRLWQILTQLVMKMGRRLRRDGFVAYGVGISMLFDDQRDWHMQEKKSVPLFTDADFYGAMRRMLCFAPEKLVRLLAVYCYTLVPDIACQSSLFPEENRKRDITKALDAIADRFGDFVIHPARMVNMEQRVLDRIAFGKVST